MTIFSVTSAYSGNSIPQGKMLPGCKITNRRLKWPIIPFVNWRLGNDLED